MIPITRFAINQLIKHRQQLKAIKRDPSHHANTILDIKPSTLKAQGIQVIALDFDGVLAHHDATTIDTPILDWLHDCNAIFGENNVYLHSNNNRPDRLEFLSQHCPYLTILAPNLKKPHPEGLLSITHKTGISPKHIALIDDRLMTGMLAACLAGCHGIYIRHPYVDYRHETYKELVFSTLRVIERILTI